MAKKWAAEELGRLVFSYRLLLACNSHSQLTSKSLIYHLERCVVSLPIFPKLLAWSLTWRQETPPGMRARFHPAKGCGLYSSERTFLLFDWLIISFCRDHIGGIRFHSNSKFTSKLEIILEKKSTMVKLVQQQENQSSRRIRIIRHFLPLKNPKSTNQRRIPRLGGINISTNSTSSATFSIYRFCMSYVCCSLLYFGLSVFVLRHLGPAGSPKVAHVGRTKKRR